MPAILYYEPVWVMVIAFALTFFTLYCAIAAENDEDGMMKAGGIVFSVIFVPMSLLYASWVAVAFAKVPWYVGVMIGTVVICGFVYIAIKIRHRASL